MSGISIRSCSPSTFTSTSLAYSNTCVMESLKSVAGGVYSDLFFPWKRLSKGEGDAGGPVAVSGLPRVVPGITEFL